MGIFGRNKKKNKEAEKVQIYTSFDIAKEVIKIASRTGFSITPFRLNKFIYLSHCWFLGIHERPLISDLSEAWEYGPMLPHLYHVTKRFGNNPVDIELIDLYSDKKVNILTKNFLNQMWNAYSHFSDCEIAAIANKCEAYAAVNMLEGKIVPIDNIIIMRHYKKKAEIARERIKNSGTFEIDLNFCKN